MGPNLRLMLIMVMEVTTAMVSMGMAMATNLHGPQSVVPVSPLNVSADVANGLLSLLPSPMDTDSTVTIPMPMAFTTLMPMDIMSLMSLHLLLPHLPLLTFLLLLLVLEVILVVPLLILTEAPKVFVARGLPKILKLQLKNLQPQLPTLLLPTPTGAVTTATN